MGKLEIEFYRGWFGRGVRESLCFIFFSTGL